MLMIHTLTCLLSIHKAKREKKGREKGKKGKEKKKKELFIIDCIKVLHMLCNIIDRKKKKKGSKKKKKKKIICRVDRKQVDFLSRIRYPSEVFVNDARLLPYCSLFFLRIHIHLNETSKSDHYYKILNTEYKVIRHGIQPRNH